ncbi:MULTISPECIES: TadE/TadG family type IV pilus assembly protein [unclassified Streptomyces]|uniref:TadE/TadG family type IV pilus assembly protein n=1 Tax=unclassified Streptomyces TaxID=2593676 RepID=UPI001BE6BC71|nr:MULTISPECIES: TadE/TadG family type IV pilus assembly protein [unclassified Streptomyces]MBT2404725.1 pilus assembly protein [Streptomyces sp. ISL-21]MBT2612627.1 pilus assembly protein [Streptomyces sp. ISL-87]
MNRQWKWRSDGTGASGRVSGGEGASGRVSGGTGVAGRVPVGRGDRGQVALEYIGFIPILLLVALCGIQLGWAAYVVQQAETAARTAARTEAREPGTGAAAGMAAIRPSLASIAEFDVSPTTDAVTVRVTIPIKSIVPGVGATNAERTAVMPNDPKVTAP